MFVSNLSHRWFVARDLETYGSDYLKPQIVNTLLVSPGALAVLDSVSTATGPS
jgi:hypothetical protein